MDAQSSKKNFPKFFFFFENAKQNAMKPSNFLFVCYCFILYTEKMLTDRAMYLKVIIEDGDETP